jgi:hypothetical protein
MSHTDGVSVLVVLTACKVGTATTAHSQHTPLTPFIHFMSCANLSLLRTAALGSLRDPVYVTPGTRLVSDGTTISLIQCDYTTRTLSDTYIRSTRALQTHKSTKERTKSGSFVNRAKSLVRMLGKKSPSTASTSSSRSSSTKGDAL